MPGRIEVFGRHTDYAGGRTLDCAIDRGFLFAAAPRTDRQVRLVEDSAAFPEVSFELHADIAPPVGQWANYPMTMARRLERNFPGRLGGVDIAFSSTLPVGSGMSGSSALMMMTFTALSASNGLEADPRFQARIRTPMDLSVYLACGENGQSFGELAGDRGVGTFGGSEDHATILNARAGFLSLFGFSPPALLDEVRWPGEWRMLVAFSGVRAEKTREALEKYNLASRRVRDAVAAYNRMAATGLPTLREVVDHQPKPPGDWLVGLELSAAGLSDLAAPALGDRVRQFILEDRTHVPGAVQALKAGELERFGKLLSDSHEASRKYLWNIVPEIDSLKEAACGLGAAGASGFGAGFGGSILAVTTAARAEELMQRWKEAYLMRFPQRASGAEFFMAHPGAGIEIWTEAGPARYVDTVFNPGPAPPAP